MKAYEIARRHLLGGLEGGAWGGFILGLHMFLQFGGYITGYLLLWFWGVIMGVVIGGAVAVLSAKSSTGLGAARGAVVGACCALLALLLVWLSSPDNGAVTPPSWAQALLAWAEIMLLLGVLPGVMAGLGGARLNELRMAVCHCAPSNTGVNRTRSKRLSHS